MKKYEPDSVLLGITRPALKWGMPIKYLYMCGTTYPVVLMYSPDIIISTFVALILWYVGIMLGSKDPFLLEIILKRSKLPKMPVKLKAYWTIKTYSPF